MYDSSVRSFANSVRCRASRSRIAVSNFSGMGDPQILTETIPLQRAKLNRPGEKAGQRREDARGRGSQQRLPTPLICHQAFIETEGSSSTSSEQDTNSAASQTEMTPDSFLFFRTRVANSVQCRRLWQLFSHPRLNPQNGAEASLAGTEAGHRGHVDLG